MAAKAGGKVKVLIVDDSAMVRQHLSRALSSDPDIEVLGVAADPFIAMNKIARSRPDVITLDVEMPRMDGLTFLRMLMSRDPIPVVMCSALTEQGCAATMKALERGAVDIILKPRVGVREFMEESRVLLCDTVKAAALARVKPLAGAILPEVPPKLTADVILARPVATGKTRKTEKVLVVGASTGGTEAIRTFLEALPPDAPGSVIVQHMPERFTSAFARRLDGICAVEVKEAEDGDPVRPGRALVAPGNLHTLLLRRGGTYSVQVKGGPLVSRHRPSVDVLFRSAAFSAGPNAIGIIMTGMGDDGARGLKEMKEGGAFTIAQDEKSSVVFGMPRVAIGLGAVDRTLSIGAIAGAVLENCS